MDTDRYLRRLLRAFLSGSRIGKLFGEDGCLRHREPRVQPTDLPEIRRQRRLRGLRRYGSAASCHAQHAAQHQQGRRQGRTRQDHPDSRLRGPAEGRHAHHRNPAGVRRMAACAARRFQGAADRSLQPQIQLLCSSTLRRQPSAVSGARPAGAGHRRPVSQPKGCDLDDQAERRRHLRPRGRYGQDAHHVRRSV